MSAAGVIALIGLAGGGLFLAAANMLRLSTPDLPVDPPAADAVDLTRAAGARIYVPTAALPGNRELEAWLSGPTVTPPHERREA